MPVAGRLHAVSHPLNRKGPFPVFNSAVLAYLRAVTGSRATRIGPFHVIFDQHDVNPYRNYAIPDDGCEPTADEVNELVTAFRDRGRTPRFEYIPEVVPSLEPTLLALGFTEELRPPLLTCWPSDVPELPDPSGVEIILARTEEQLRLCSEAQQAAYGEGDIEHDVRRKQSAVDEGSLIAVAVDTATGQGVGGAELCPPHDGVSELAGVGVRASHGGRGIATALTAKLTRWAPAAGITTPWLMPGHDRAEQIYRRVGYHQVGRMLHISLAR
ncbi:GNAT family N-acetyltransferase [Pseudonocardiaceae bacterium YIM PH 21723]|nr:GNAT family N-acetyltransferase [Pseudonocardiaceae bacterium YIM PH 21723]